MNEVKNILEFAMNVALRSGRILLEHYNQSMEVRSKSSEIDLVTEADLASERFIVQTIRKKFPKHGILSEEEVEDNEAREFSWIIDPLDGTVNYTHGFPIFCVSLALQYQGDPLLGVTHDPTRDETFTVVKHLGAFLDGERLNVSQAKTLVQSLVATGFPYKRATIEDNNLPEFNRVLPKVQGIRRGGSAALDLAYVAAGRLDGYWEAHLSPWDWAAGVLMIQEAGGRVTDRTGQPWTLESKKMVATNGFIHEELLQVVSGYD